MLNTRAHNARIYTEETEHKRTKKKQLTLGKRRFYLLRPRRWVVDILGLGRSMEATLGLGGAAEDDEEAEGAEGGGGGAVAAATAAAAAANLFFASTSSSLSSALSSSLVGFLFSISARQTRFALSLSPVSVSVSALGQKT